MTTTDIGALRMEAEEIERELNRHSDAEFSISVTPRGTIDIEIRDFIPPDAYDSLREAVRDRIKFYYEQAQEATQ
jgi:hypothetical protein